ncbi:MAG: ectonucleotide pyrophosphatase/phosphodiesterase [Myxococcota bacterium]|nr:ectonucleotide pyrophosphatase/phosphodiesterase [Myxococcota bacterium]
MTKKSARRTALVAVLMAPLVLACPTPPATSAPRLPSVVLISLDGTRPADLREDTLPSLLALGRRGLVAEGLVAAVPTNTFPNHVTLVTGVAPERHGLVNNVFWDPQRGLFSKDDIPTWIEVEPIWSIVERAGLVSASYYWVGSEGRWTGSEAGLAPRYWKAFSSWTSESSKVDQILEWLEEPDSAHRPRLITSWFHGADHSGHDHGPGSAEVEGALGKQDKAISRLIRRFDERGLFETTTLIFVSDHGMAAPSRKVDLESYLQEAGIDARVMGIGGFATVVPGDGEPADPEFVQRVIERARELDLEAFAPSSAPPRAGVDHPRFGAVVIRADEDTAIVRGSVDLVGFHGYRPENPSMRAILVAAGRGVKPGRTLGLVPSVDIAPTVLDLLSLPVPGWMEGRPIPAFDESP